MPFALGSIRGLDLCANRVNSAFASDRSVDGSLLNERR